jgi:hypothetical protein
MTIRAARMRLAAVASALALVAAVAPGARADTDGVTLLDTLIVPGAVSAKVVDEAGKPRWMYVSAASGFLVYDLSDPAAPREVGRLPLPTYQNEDLDGSSDLALLVDDVPVQAKDSAAGGNSSSSLPWTRPGRSRCPRAAAGRRGPHRHLPRAVPLGLRLERREPGGGGPDDAGSAGRAPAAAAGGERRFP